jgi:hypothetical protein
VIVVEGSGMRWNDREGRGGKFVGLAFYGLAVDRSCGKGEGEEEVKGKVRH